MEKAWLSLAEWLTTGQWVGPFIRLVIAAAIVTFGLLASRIVSSGLRRLRERSRAGRPLIYIVEKLAGYGLIVAGLLIGLASLGINLTSLAVFAGALGVG